MPRTKTLDEFSRPTGTVIGKSVTLHIARMVCSDTEAIRIDGTINGDIEIAGVLLLSDTGHINGNITAGYTRIAGKVVGNIKCRNALHLASTAHIVGDITTAALIIDDGAVFMGACQTHIEMPSMQAESLSL